MFFSPLAIFVALLWTLFSASMSFLNCGYCNWTECSRHNLTSADYIGMITFLSLSVILLWMQPKILFPEYVSHTWKPSVVGSFKWLLFTIFLRMRKDKGSELGVLSLTLKSDWQWDHLSCVMRDFLLPFPSCMWQTTAQNLFLLPRRFELVNENMWISLIFFGGFGRNNGQ